MKLDRGYHRNLRKEYLHRVVYVEKKGPIPKGYIIHHKNSNRADNRITNLQAMTRSEHMALHKVWTFRKNYVEKKQTGIKKATQRADRRKATQTRKHSTTGMV